MGKAAGQKRCFMSRTTAGNVNPFDQIQRATSNMEISIFNPILDPVGIVAVYDAVSFFVPCKLMTAHPGLSRVSMCTPEVCSPSH